MGGFALDLQSFGEKSVGRVNLIVRKVSLDLLREVVLRTPVRTGRARANWQTTIGAPAAGEISWDKDSPDAAAPSAIDAGSQRLNGQEARMMLDGDLTIFLTNNLPYIDALEHGSSLQAPEGMVRQAVAMFPYLVDMEAKASMSSMPRSME
jgi:hypothetical protein